MVLVTILIAVILGFLSGLGTGGGSLLIVWLTAAVGLSQADARIINLMFFVPSAVISTLFHWKRQSLPMGIIVSAAISGCLCAAVASYIAELWIPDALRPLLGIFLILSGLRELFYRPRKAR